MNPCETCPAYDCMHCVLGNPCIGCADYDPLHDTCTSNGACGNPDKKLKRVDGYPDKNMKEQKNDNDN